MIISTFGLLRYVFVAVFGIALSATFAGIDFTRRNIIKLALFSLAAIIIQFTSYALFGLTFTQKLYPVIVHLPLMILLIAAFKVQWSMSIVSVLSAYLCCQIPRWFSAITFLWSSENLYSNLVYIIIAPIIFIMLHMYVAKPLQNLMIRSRGSTYLCGAMPLLYYVFDYICTRYTELLYTGEPFIVQFMPSLMSTFYFFFLLIYSSGLDSKDKAYYEKELMSMQLQRTQSELDTIHQMRRQAQQYRHDLRHHFALLMGFAEENNMDKIKEFLQESVENLNSYKLKHFSDNEVVDLILSHFDSIASEHGVKLSVIADIPDKLPIEDIELCSIISNGLENAIEAARKIPNDADKFVAVSITAKQHNLLISITNPYTGSVIIKNGIPVSPRAEHGMGTRSIISIATNNYGYASFNTDGSLFYLRILIPFK